MIRAIQAGGACLTPLSHRRLSASSARKMTPGKLRAAMKRLGFADIIEVAIGADPCAAQGVLRDFLEEVPEKLPNGGDFPLSRRGR